MLVTVNSAYAQGNLPVSKSPGQIGRERETQKCNTLAQHWRLTPPLPKTLTIISHIIKRAHSPSDLTRTQNLISRLLSPTNNRQFELLRIYIVQTID